MDGNLGLRSPGLILLSGLPGSGKTTFARAVAERLDAVHLESDAIRRDLAAHPSYLPSEHAAVFSRLERRAGFALAGGRHVVVDATNLNERDRHQFLRLADRTEAVLVPVRLTAPDEVIRNRLSVARDGFSQAGIEVYEMMRGRARPFARPALVVDTRFPLATAVDLVCRLLHDRW